MPWLCSTTHSTYRCIGLRNLPTRFILISDDITQRPYLQRYGLVLLAPCFTHVCHAKGVQEFLKIAITSNLAVAGQYSPQLFTVINSSYRCMDLRTLPTRLVPVSDDVTRRPYLRMYRLVLLAARPTSVCQGKVIPEWLRIAIISSLAMQANLCRGYG